jgi:type II secretory pathway pseudopilin PulG
MLNIFTQKQKSNNKGYTLIEVVLVISLTGVTFITLYALYASTVRRNVDNRYEVIASNLAQEGVEIVRNVRDENVMLTNPINTGMTASCFPYFRKGTPIPECDNTRKKEIEVVSGEYRNCLLSGCIVPADKIVFSRTCSIGGNFERMVVTCTVEWKSFVNASITRKADATVTLTDWQE